MLFHSLFYFYIMKLKSLFAFAFSSLILTACSSDNTTFNQDDLKPEIYNGYWAMSPVNDQYRVVKFQQNGSVKIYDYTCDNYNQTYTLNQTETVYLRKIKQNHFTLLDNNKKPFAKFEILRLTSHNLNAKQYFDNERPLVLNYTHIIGAKPMCG